MSLRVVTTLTYLLASWLTKTPCLWRSTALMFTTSRHTLQRYALFSHALEGASWAISTHLPTHVHQLHVLHDVVAALFICCHMFKCSAVIVQACLRDVNLHIIVFGAIFCIVGTCSLLQLQVSTALVAILSWQQFSSVQPTSQFKTSGLLCRLLARMKPPLCWCMALELECLHGAI